MNDEWTHTNTVRVQEVLSDGTAITLGIYHELVNDEVMKSVSGVHPRKHIHQENIYPSLSTVLCVVNRWLIDTISVSGCL